MADYYTQELDNVHRWLPPEIFADIGIVDFIEQRRLAVVEDLAVRLAGVLGGTRETAQHPSLVRWFDGNDIIDHDVNAQREAMSPFFPAPTVQWKVGAGLRNGRIFDSAPMHQLRIASARCNSGTGVFLPRTEVYQTKAAQPLGNDVRPRKQCRQKQRRREEESTTARSHQHHAVATIDAACLELSLPQEWTY